MFAKIRGNIFLKNRISQEFSLFPKQLNILYLIHVINVYCALKSKTAVNVFLKKKRDSNKCWLRLDAISLFFFVGYKLLNQNLFLTSTNHRLYLSLSFSFRFLEYNFFAQIFFILKRNEKKKIRFLTFQLLNQNDSLFLQNSFGKN